MTPRIRIGTRDGLWELDGDRVFAVEAFAGKSLTALAADGAREWAIADAPPLGEGVARGWPQVARIEGYEATCLAATREGLLIGTEQAHLLRLTGDGVAPVESFETTDGRAAWYTPWGDPADVRSISVARDGAV